MEMTLDFDAAQEDRLLMRQLVQREPTALAKLCRRYKAILKSVVMQVVHNEADAEDVLQDVFIQVWDRAKTYSADKGKLISWLSTMARRRAIDRVRQHCAYRRATDRYEVECNHPDKGFSETHAVEYAVNQCDLKELIGRYILALPMLQQEAIHLSFYEGKSQREISSITGTPLGTVKTRIELGIKKLSHSISGMREKIV
jgi:RNA polymerase sigma-70 factor (ECF subfamily)